MQVTVGFRFSGGGGGGGLDIFVMISVCGSGWVGSSELRLCYFCLGLAKTMWTYFPLFYIIGQINWAFHAELDPKHYT
jgi:hypothetical protein